MLAGGLKRVDSSSALVTGARRAFTTCRAILLPNAPFGRTAERVLLEDAARRTEQEELDEPRHHGLAALALDDVDDLVVRRGVELHQDSPTTPTRGLVPSPCKGSVSKSSTICLTVRLNSPRFTPRASWRLHSAIQWSKRAFALPGSTS